MGRLVKQAGGFGFEKRSVFLVMIKQLLRKYIYVCIIIKKEPCSHYLPNLK